MNPSELQEAVEKLVDKSRVQDVLNALATTCFLKAQHLEENWQDSREASYWHRLGRTIDAFAVKTRKFNL